MALRSGVYIVPTNRWYIERTVWLIAGVFLLTATALAALVDPRWVLLVVPPAVASIIVSLTGFCIVGNVLRAVRLHADARPGPTGRRGNSTSCRPTRGTSSGASTWRWGSTSRSRRCSRWSTAPGGSLFTGLRRQRHGLVRRHRATASWPMGSTGSAPSRGWLPSAPRMHARTHLPHPRPSPSWPSGRAADHHRAGLRVPRWQGATSDPQAQVGEVPPVFPPEEPEDGQAPQPGHLRDARGGRQARAGDPVLQAALSDRILELTGVRDG